jgi:uncharacterized protein YdeI (YjbR/CyaY-like superfamily)
MDCRRSRTNDPDKWIETCEAFSRPVCEELREVVQRFAPDLSESIKWNMLCFSGRKLVCAIGGYQKHAELCFFRGAELPDALFNRGENNKAIRGILFTAVEQIDRKALGPLIATAANLDIEPPMPLPSKPKREPWPMPEDLAVALEKNRAAAAFFAELKPTYQREYMVWVSTAKRPETRAHRLEQTVRALAARRKWLQRKEA